MKKYWMCIIEINTKKQLPQGFDSIPRRSAIDAIEAKRFEVENCWSGWGTTGEKIEEIQQLWNQEAT